MQSGDAVAEYGGRGWLKLVKAESSGVSSEGIITMKLMRILNLKLGEIGIGFEGLFSA